MSRTLLLLNGLYINSYAQIPLDGESTLDLIQRYVEKLRGIDEVKLLLPTEQSFVLDFPTVQCPLGTEKELIKALQEVASGFQTIVYSWADFPFLSPELTKRLLHLHRQYFCEYTFADGYPVGMAPEVLEYPSLEMMGQLATTDVCQRNSLFAICSRDINAFDIETEIAEEDYCLLRLELSSRTLRTHHLCKNLSMAGGKSSDAQLLHLLKTRRDLLRGLPSYARVQITTRSVPSALYDPPLPSVGYHDMSLEHFTQLVDDFAEFSPGIILELGYRGEAALHPQLYEFLHYVKKHPLQVYLHTSGLGWSDDLLQKVISHPLDNITVIVAVDSNDPSIYAKIRNADMGQVQKTAHMLLSHHPQNCYIETTRMRDTASDLEAFFRYWKEKTKNIIIRKYNDYCGKLSSRKVTDLSPLYRFPCWQLQRELSILSDGSVSLCTQDIEGDSAIGQVFTDGLAQVWDKMDEYYQKHVREEYMPLCTHCDEYYIFNG